MQIIRVFLFSFLFIYHYHTTHIRTHNWETEDGSEVGGSWTHLLLHPTGTPSQSSKEQSEQPTEFQLIWSLKAKGYKGHLKTDVWDNKMWSCEKTKDRSRKRSEGKHRQLRQISLRYHSDLAFLNLSSFCLISWVFFVLFVWFHCLICFLYSPFHIMF